MEIYASWAHVSRVHRSRPHHARFTGSGRHQIRRGQPVQQQSPSFTFLATPDLMAGESGRTGHGRVNGDVDENDDYAVKVSCLQLPLNYTGLARLHR